MPPPPILGTGSGLAKTIEEVPTGGRTTVRIPTAHAENYRKARPTDPVAVDNYLRHTGIGDPVLDPIMEELSGMPTADRMPDHVHTAESTSW